MANNIDTSPEALRAFADDARHWQSDNHHAHWIGQVRETLRALAAEKAADSKCHVCGDLTNLRCSDCAIDLHAAVAVCSKTACRDAHERKCAAVVAELVREREYGWVIERGDSSPAAPTYWSGPDQWSQVHMDAVRFARKEDAERVACRLGQGYHRVCEHGWG